MIHYELIKNKIYKNGELITKPKAKKELGNFRFSKLMKLGKCSMHDKNKPEPKEKVPKLSREEKARIREEKLYQNARDNYIIEYHNHKVCLWRRNKHYGYFNFVKYLVNDDDNTVRQAIMLDIKNGDSDIS